MKPISARQLGVTDVLRERGILGRRVRMNPYFNAVRILCAVAVKRNKELRLTDIRFPAPPGEGDKSIVVARHADLDPARFQLFFYRQRKLEIVVLFEPALILSAGVVPAVTGVEADVNTHAVQNYSRRQSHRGGNDKADDENSFCRSFFHMSAVNHL